jgi:hypothetical protein
MENFLYYKSIIISLLFFNNLMAFTTAKVTQDDTVKTPNIAVVPTINGFGDDECWQNIPWQGIDQIWIPDTAVIPAEDYTGHYKIAWSSATNLLYFLIEVNDDVFVDGYKTGATADIYNFDITEVFIDEDASGGWHQFDGGQQNAENAFAYHIYADYPDEGNVTTDPYVWDMATIAPNYDFHFPEFALRKNGNTATWEFSLIVYNDTYSPTRIDSARVQLHADKVLGLSVAYCDNDKADGMRDNMFGSVWEPAPKNRHWQNADYFGTIKLVQSISTGIENEQTAKINSIKVYPNPSSSIINLQVDDPNNGEVAIRLFNILGQEVFRISDIKTSRLFNKTIFLNNISTGIYFLQTQLGKIIFSKKLLIH